MNFKTRKNYGFSLLQKDARKHIKNDFSGKPDSFMNQQYDLIVGTVDSRITGTDKGVLRFYSVPGARQKLVEKGKPYTGFGEIVDVVYRERP